MTLSGERQNAARNTTAGAEHGLLKNTERERFSRARRSAGTDGALFTPWLNDIRDQELACAKAGVARVTTNDLRRSHAVNMHLEGLPLETIAPDMSHADTRMLERVYRRLTPVQLAAKKHAVLAARRKRTAG